MEARCARWRPKTAAKNTLKTPPRRHRKQPPTHIHTKLKNKQNQRRRRPRPRAPAPRRPLQHAPRRLLLLPALDALRRPRHQPRDGRHGRDLRFGLEPAQRPAGAGEAGDYINIYVYTHIYSAGKGREGDPNPTQPSHTKRIINITPKPPLHANNFNFKFKRHKLLTNNTTGARTPHGPEERRHDVPLSHARHGRGAHDAG